MASFLEYQVNDDKGDKPKASGYGFDNYGGEDDYGDYGAEYGSDDEYVTEDIGNAKKAFKDMDFGMNPDLMMDGFGVDEGDYFDDEEDDYNAIPNSQDGNEEIILIGDLMEELNDPMGEKTKR